MQINYHFCELEKTSFKSFKVFRRVNTDSYEILYTLCSGK